MEELKRLRTGLGWSQQRLANESGVNKATINQVEQGKRSPSIQTLESLARAMGAEVGDFFPKAQASLWSDEPAGRRDAETAEKLLRFGNRMVARWESEMGDRLDAADEEWLRHVVELLAEYVDILFGVAASGFANREESHAQLLSLLTFVQSLEKAVDPEYKHRFEIILEESGLQMEQLVGVNL